MPPLTIIAVTAPLEIPEKTCNAPNITNVATKKLSDGVIWVTWDYSRINGLRYCSGSRRFLVAFHSYETYDRAIADTTSLTRDLAYEAAGRRTKQFNVTGVDFTLFHRFYVSTQKSISFTTTTAYTPLQHFREVGEWLC